MEASSGALVNDDLSATMRAAGSSDFPMAILILVSQGSGAAGVEAAGSSMDNAAGTSARQRPDSKRSSIATVNGG